MWDCEKVNQKDNFNIDHDLSHRVFVRMNFYLDSWCVVILNNFEDQENIRKVVTTDMRKSCDIKKVKREIVTTDIGKVVTKDWNDWNKD